MTEHLSSRLTWDRCGVIILVVLAVGQIVAMIRPVWFAPPLTGLTPIIYLLLALAWLIVLVVCLLLKPSGDQRRWLFRLLVIGALMTGFWYTMISPSAGWGLLDSANVTCRSEPLADSSLVRHICTYTAGYHSEAYVLDGAQGSPFATFVEMRYMGS